MNEQSKDLSAFFEAALAADSEQERQAIVDQTCQQDPELGQQLKNLLQAHEKAGKFLSAPPPELAATQLGSVEPPTADSTSARPSILQLIGQTIAEELPRIVLDSSPDEGAGPIVRPNSKQLPQQQHEDSRYQLQGEIARGGMGAILKGRDVDLGRDLAVKVLLDEHKDKPAVIQRFVEEAQIGGQLQHPGIVPVYELGQFKDQRPFFTMKLVKGKTLSALLEERASPEQDRAKFLGIFEQICQTMAYAHSRGVIHRDLKPSNVMVGAFGEVQVMDWGLAKVLSEGGVADEKKAFDNRTKTSIIQTIRSLGSDTPASFGPASLGSQTQMGSVMGTPAYMPPEQALGEIDRLDQRSDVFGLGAILCEILTGQPPYTGKDHTEVFRNASRAKLESCFERLQSHSTDEDLVGIVRNTLQPEPEDRIRDAGVLTNRISDYLASLDSRMRAAELANVEANTRATEERKRRKVLMALAASVLLTMGLAGGGYLYVKQQQAELASTQAQKEREDDARRLQVKSQIASELATARALAPVDSDSGQLPDRNSVDRALAAVDRASKLLESEALGESIGQQVDSERLQLMNHKHDHDLIVDLENAWQTELEFRAEQERRSEEHRVSFDTINSASDSEGGAVSPIESQVELPNSQLDPIAAYDQAFNKWGLTPETSVDEAVQRLQAVHPSLQPMVFTSLDRWRSLLEEPITIEGWQQSQWKQLETVELKSRGGDKLQELDDGSILASGKNPWAGYSLTFDTDATQLTALRLEALLHPSLPNQGPGRGVRGTFSMEDLVVYVAPRDSIEDRKPLNLKTAVADYSWERIPIDVEQWNITFAAGKPHVAVYAPASPVESDSGFRLWIETGDRDRGPWDNQNLGRFRWSISSDQRNAMSQRIDAKALGQIADQADNNAWATEMRSEMQRKDILGLIRRAVGDECTQQPNQSLIRLATFLRKVQDHELFAAIPKAVRWNHLVAPKIQSSGSVEYELLEDGSLLASGANPLEETIEITATIDQPITAVRLDLVPDERSEAPTPNAGRIGPIAIHDISLELVSKKDGSVVQDIPFSFALSSFQWPMPLGDAIDGKSSSMLHVIENAGAQSMIFTVKSPPVDPGTELRIRMMTGGEENFQKRNFQRFRFSLTSDELGIDDVDQASESLLKLAVKNDASDFWTRLSLAETLQKRRPPKLEESMRQATAAIALRPGHEGGHAALLRSIRVDQLRDDELLPLALTEVEYLCEFDEDHAAVKSLVNDLMSEANRLVDEKESELAIETYQLVLQLRPNDARQHFNVAWQISDKLRDHEAAKAVYQRSIDIAPTVRFAHNNLGYCYQRLGNQEMAEKWYRKEIELFPKTAGIAYSNTAYFVAKREQYDEAFELCRKGIQSAPHDSRIYTVLAGFFKENADLTQGLRETGILDKTVELMQSGTKAVSKPAPIYDALGLMLSLRGDFAEAEKASRKAIELDDDNARYQFNLANHMAKSGKSAEAIGLKLKALKLDPKNPKLLFELTQDLVTNEVPKLWNPDLAIELAEKGLTIDEDSGPLLTALGVAYYRAGRWKEAVETLNKVSNSAGDTEGVAPFFLAMAHWKLDDKQEARKLFHEATKWMKENRPDDADLIRFHAEAEGTINTEPTATDD